MKNLFPKFQGVFCFAIAMLLAHCSLLVHAQAPKTLSYQGRLTNGATPLNGNFNVTFAIYDAASGGNMLWTEQSAVSVQNGNFSTILGKTTPVNVPSDKPLWLGIQVESNPEISPRVELTANLYSLGLALPFAQTTSSPASAFDITSTGSTGAAGEFKINNPTGTNTTLNVSTNGIGNAGYFLRTGTSLNVNSRASAALNVENQGPGAGAFFGKPDGSGFGSVVEAIHLGTGDGAASFGVLNSSSSANTIFAQTTGTGSVAYLTHNGASGNIIEFNSSFNKVASIDKQGNIQAAKFIGDGSLLTNLPSSGLSLPFIGSTPSETTAFSITSNSASNGVANFNISNATNTAFHAVSISNAGSGTGVYVANVGTGSAGDFRVLNASNGSTAINAFTTGTGSAGTFSVNNTSSSASAISAVTSGTGVAGGFSSVGNGPAGGFQAMGGGRAIYALVNSASNPSPGLDIQNFGAGRAAFFTTGNASNSVPAIEGTTNGSGSGLRLTLTNASNAAAAISITHSGTGNAITANRPIQATQFIGDGSLLTNVQSSSLSLPFSSTGSSASSLFTVTNGGTGGAIRGTSASGYGIYGESTGSATAGFFIGNSATGSSSVLYSVGNGLGSSGYFSVQNASNNQPALRSETVGTGPAFYGRNTGTSGYAGEFLIQNSSNSSYAFVGHTFGLGTAGLVQIFNSSNPNPSLFTTTNGTGPAITAEQTGSGQNIALFQVSGTNVSRIDKTGKGFFNGGTQTGGADVAEMFDIEGARSAYEPGDVLVISENTDRTVEKSSESNSTKVAGVFATKPGVILTQRDIEQNIDDLVPMGVIGVIPTKVCNQNGAIKRGDLLVTSSIGGHAMKAQPIEVNGVKIYLTGAILGKALENFDGEKGLINVLVNVK
jgi:hypothetical protein